MNFVNYHHEFLIGTKMCTLSREPSKDHSKEVSVVLKKMISKHIFP